MIIYQFFRVYSAHNPTYTQRISLESNSEQLSQTTSTISRDINNNHHCHSLKKEEEGESKHENVYHILENPAGDDDVYEVLDKYEQKDEDQGGENVYHILDGPTVIEEESEGVATLTSSDRVTGKDHETTIQQTSTSTDGHL